MDWVPTAKPFESAWCLMRFLKGMKWRQLTTLGPFKRKSPLRRRQKRWPPYFSLLNSAGIGQRQVAQDRCQVTQAQEDSLTCQGFSSISGL